MSIEQTQSAVFYGSANGSLKKNPIVWLVASTLVSGTPFLFLLQDTSGHLGMGFVVLGAMVLAGLIIGMAPIQYYFKLACFSLMTIALLINLWQYSVSVAPYFKRTVLEEFMSELPSMFSFFLLPYIVGLVLGVLLHRRFFLKK